MWVQVVRLCYLGSRVSSALQFWERQQGGQLQKETWGVHQLHNCWNTHQLTVTGWWEFVWPLTTRVTCVTVPHWLWLWICVYVTLSHIHDRSAELRFLWLCICQPHPSGIVNRLHQQCRVFLDQGNCHLKPRDFLHLGICVTPSNLCKLYMSGCEELHLYLLVNNWNKNPWGIYIGFSWLCLVKKSITTMCICLYVLAKNIICLK